MKNTLLRVNFSVIAATLGFLLVYQNIFTKKTPRFGIFEKTFFHSESYANPYLEVRATARFISSEGKSLSIPIFWDGGARWKVRFSPNKKGIWKWSTTSSDPGLNSKSGSFKCISSSKKGGIQEYKSNPYHFQYQDGTPFWFFGDTLWRAFGSDPEEDLNRSSIRHYINIRSSQKFNYVHANLLSPGENEGGPAFLNYDIESINPRFWQEVDRRITYLNKKGITVMIMLAWANDTPSWITFSSNPARFRYARYVAARYSAFNVCFNVSGEWNETGSKAMYQAIGKKIANVDPHSRMIAIHGVDSVEEFANESWMSFGDYQQVYEALHERILSARIHNKPVVNSEYAYYLRDKNGDGIVDKPNSATLEEIRHATWDIIMAGGYFVTGWGTTYNGGRRDPGPFNPDDPRNDDWEEDVPHIRTLFTGLEWWELKPSDNLVKGSGTLYCLAKKGKQYVVYIRGEMGVKSLYLGQSKPGSYSIKRFNPRNGRFRKLPTYYGTGPIFLTPVDEQDWVFVVLNISSSAI